MQALEIIEVAGSKVICDGGVGALGHPRIYLTFGGGEELHCPYCGRRYIRKVGEGGGVTEH